MANVLNWKEFISAVLLLNLGTTVSVIHDFSDHWINNFNNLSCPHSTDGDHWKLPYKNVTNNETNYSYDQEIELLSHVCLNGSFAHLSNEEWNERCYPSYWVNAGWRRAAGVWLLFNFIVGTLGNTLTLTAVAYARSKHRYDFHRYFSTTTIWILHLAVCDLIFCIFAAPMYFIPWLGYRYPQGYGWDGWCKFSIIVAYMAVFEDWLLLSYIAMTRAINLKWRDKWEKVCSNKIYLVLMQCSSWVICFLVWTPVFVQPSQDLGYYCMMGKCNLLPTGRKGLQVFED